MSSSPEKQASSLGRNRASCLRWSHSEQGRGRWVPLSPEAGRQCLQLGIPGLGSQEVPGKSAGRSSSKTLTERTVWSLVLGNRLHAHPAHRGRAGMGPGICVIAGSPGGSPGTPRSMRRRAGLLQAPRVRDGPGKAMSHTGVLSTVARPPSSASPCSAVPLRTALHLLLPLSHTPAAPHVCSPSRLPPLHTWHQVFPKAF